MIRHLITHFFSTIFWWTFFRTLDLINFRVLLNNFIVLILSLNSIQVFRLFRDLIHRTITNNVNFRIFAITNRININSLIDTNKKIFFWIGFVFTIILYKWFILMKKVLLWPFKLGVFSFIYSIIGIDMSWFLKFFDFFTINIPKWVFFQYLNLYSNWLNWWNNTAKIKNLNTDSLPTIKNFSNITENNELVESSEGYNKKKWIIIGVITFAVIGLGYWYYYYSGNVGGGAAGGGGGNPGNPAMFIPNPPAPSVPSVPSNTTSSAIDATHRISITDNQSINNPFPVLDSQLIDNSLPVTNTPNVVQGTNEAATTSNSSPTHPDPRLARDYDRLFQKPESSTSQAGGSSSTLSDSPSSPIHTERPNSPPIGAEGSNSNSKPTYAEVARSSSPTGSDGSNDTITNLSYTDSKGKSKVAIPRGN